MRRLLTLLLLVASLGLVSRGVVSCDVLQAQPQCYVALHPGPTDDTLAIVELLGEPVYVSTGQLLLTTVGVDSSLDLLEWISGRFDPTIRLIDRDIIFPPDQDAEQVQERNAAQMEGSQIDAVLAALNYLGRATDLEQTGARVVSVEPDAPAAGVVLPGDVVVAVEGQAVQSPAEAVEVLGSRAAGDRVTLTVRREGATEDLEVELYERGDDPGHAVVGITLSPEVELPIDVSIDAGAIGGPSAGSMFALAIIDILGEEDLTGGRVIAGTGTITPDGAIGPIGGIQQKIIGAVERTDDTGKALPPAEYFLAPADNVAEARQAPVGDRRITIIPVATLADAVAALRDLREGIEPAGAFALGPTG